MSTSRIEETHETPLSSEEVAHLQQSIMRQYTQAILVLKEFFDKQEQFHNETIGANIDQAFSKLLGSPSLSSEERQTLCYYQCLYFEIKSDLAENPFTTPKKFKEESFKASTSDISQIPEDLRDIYRVCTGPEFDKIFSACAKEQAEIYAPCSLLLQALILKHQSLDVIEGGRDLASGLITLQQHLARYNLLIEALRNSLLKIIAETRHAIQRIETSSGADKIRDKAIMAIEQQKACAIQNLLLVEMTLQKLKPKLEFYNSKITSSAKEDILRNFLCSLEAERKKLEQKIDSTERQVKKIKTVTAILDATADNLINHKSIGDILAIIIRIHSDAEHYDAFRKERVGLFSIFRAWTNINKIVNNFIQHIYRLQPLDTTPVIASPMAMLTTPV